MGLVVLFDYVRRRSIGDDLALVQPDGSAAEIVEQAEVVGCEYQDLSLFHELKHPSFGFLRERDIPCSHDFVN